MGVRSEGSGCWLGQARPSILLLMLIRSGLNFSSVTKAKRTERTIRASRNPSRTIVLASSQMKQLLNEPVNIVKEAVEGYVASHAHLRLLQVSDDVNI